MEKKNIDGIINFEDYRVLEVSYKLNKEFYPEDAINIKFDLGHGYQISDDQMLVQYGVKVFENAEKQNFPFEIKVIIEGLFTTKDSNVDFEKFLPNALAILFPYIRSIVSTYTAVANIAPLNLPTINTIQYLEDSKDKGEHLEDF
ncbi:protein-export chaperone SecB [Peptoniphilus indolicus]|uniref:Preprotein translocase subunit SecB n=2 Tax=Peptoniphilus indolicus TaxID=33030 RepID=G4D5E2_9FIRM|nr:protein-export chaperone SecB [Peptoniphilus indolicus]EGY78988.1 hypothetical protein HMPREF9129_1622 [Peptoniphilus indolicus ATCC 29427]SUB74358.1 protein-export chaperone SecB [Peptoniphilus indolicus]